jgi:hypothetical protein
MPLDTFHSSQMSVQSIMLPHPSDSWAQPASYKTRSNGSYLGVAAHSHYVLTEAVTLEYERCNVRSLAGTKTVHSQGFVVFLSHLGQIQG